MKKVSFKNSKGDKLVGVISNAGRSKDKLVVILAHGFTSSKDSDTYTTLAEELEKRDITSFRFDFFGHGESEGEFEHITVSEATDDILQAIAFLRKLGYQHIGLMGSSFGGAASIMAASKTSDLFVLALKSPVSNYLEREKAVKTKQKLEDWKKRGYRYYESSKGKKYKLNYTFFKDFKYNNGWKVAPQITVPTLIVHGNADSAVPFEQSVTVGKLIPSCKLHAVEKADHWYKGPGEFDEMIETLVEFLVKHARKARS